MKRKVGILVCIITILSFLILPQHSHAQLRKNPEARINNPLGFSPLNLHLGRGAMYVSALTGVAYFLNKKNKEVEDKRLSFYLENGTMWGYRHPATVIPETNLGFNFKVLKWLSYGADMGVYFPKDEFNQSSGFSMLRIFNRFYFRDTDKFRLWFESGVGVVYFTKIFPVATDRSDRFGTYWNGVVKYGLCAEFNINPALSVLIGARHLHFSNADIKGRQRNPSSDSHGFFVGVSYQPRKVAKAE